MFLEIVKSIFGNFAKTYGFIIKKVEKNYILFIMDTFDIVLSYDDRENEIYIDFDLSKHPKMKEYPNELQLPVFLNLDVIGNYFGVQLSRFQDNKELSLKERLKMKFNHFKYIWNKLLQNEKFEIILLDILYRERIALKEVNELQNYQSIIVKANNFFKAKEYRKTVELLNPYTDNLDEYNKKVLQYAKMKMKS